MAENNLVISGPPQYVKPIDPYSLQHLLHHTGGQIQPIIVMFYSDYTISGLTWPASQAAEHSLTHHRPYTACNTTYPT